MPTTKSKKIMADVYSMEGKKMDTVDLAAGVFGVRVSPALIARANKVQMNNARIAISHTKIRSERRGGGRKPWKQKGTGRARHGSTRSPIWRKGGVTFGPRSERNFALKINDKEKRQALRGILSQHAAEKDGIIVIDDLKMADIKTKTLSSLVSKLPIKRSTLMLTDKADKKISLSARNLENLKALTLDNINVADLLRFNQLILSKAGLAVLTKKYSTK